ncbi:MAG: coenzyme F420 hydrogenase/dehydrogenase beta subunit N-terminal domain-containing protein, partial [Lachnospiraceae bacterium]|nr:coenzyme F420 hydrogenase/dehydrogenase beta subunit N-terminal domain-containing protein [Lachnospiraceae bacterium]
SGGFTGLYGIWKLKNEMDFSKIWEKKEKIYVEWSTDVKVRKIVSSGGVLTEIASWLLENG